MDFDLYPVLPKREVPVKNGDANLGHSVPARLRAAAKETRKYIPTTADVPPPSTYALGLEISNYVVIGLKPQCFSVKGAALRELHPMEFMDRDLISNLSKQ
jgi:hypothetical protein